MSDVRWEPIRNSKGLTDYLEQGATVWVTNDGTTLAVYVNGVGGAINNPDDIRLCRAVPVESPAAPGPLTPELVAALQAALNDIREGVVSFAADEYEPVLSAWLEQIKGGGGDGNLR